MPVQAIALMSALISGQPPGAGALPVERVAAPCAVVVEGKCIAERVNETRAGDGGKGGNGTVQYNIYFGANPTGGGGGDGGNVKGAPSGPGRSPATGASPSLPRDGGAPSASGLEGAVSYFTWTYDFEPEPGQRVWSRSGGRWSERYPSGRVAKVFDSVQAGSVKGCQGQLVSNAEDPGFEVFIPNKGCARMVTLFRRDMGSWSTMGPMRDVR